MRRSQCFVQLEKSDLTGAILRAIPPERRIIAWRGKAYSLAELRESLYQITFTPARW